MLAGAVPDWLPHSKLMQSHLAISLVARSGHFVGSEPQDERIEAGCVEIDDDAEGDVQVTHPGFEVRNAQLRQV